MPVVWLSVPHYKQEFPYSCVAACLRMVLAHYGRFFTEAEVRQYLSTGAHGTRARDLLVVESLGFDVQIETSHLAQLASALGSGIPPIVFLETSLLPYWKTPCDHVAVVVGLDLPSVYLNDPYFESAPQQPTLADFQNAWASNEHLAVFIRPCS